MTLFPMQTVTGRHCLCCLSSLELFSKFSCIHKALLLPKNILRAILRPNFKLLFENGKQQGTG